MSKLSMRTFFPILVPFSIVAGFSFGAFAAPGPCVVDPLLGDPIYAEMQTTAGDIAIELWPSVAPCTVNNFLDYVDSGRYDETFVHRTVDNFVIQAGGYEYDPGTDTFSSIPRDPAVVNEPGASNLTATLAMARIGGQVNSATSEFFVNLVDNTGLDSVDGGFTVFGRVAPGDMVVVDAIAALPRLVGRWSLESSLRETFGELPVHTLPIEPPGGYGCFDPDATPELGLSGWTRALVNVPVTALEPDPLTGAIFYLSDTCSGAGAVAPPSVPCATNRSVAYWAGGWFIDPTLMTCDRIAESEESLAARRADQQPQVGAELVELSTIVVPEPGSTVLLVSGIFGLLAISRSRFRSTARRA